MMLINGKGNETFKAKIELSKNEISITINNVLFSETDKDKHISANNLLYKLAKKMCKKGYEFQCCGACKHFRFSGMSMQMSNGRTGYCELIGFRNSEAIVEIDYYCNKFSKIYGWPYEA